MENLVIVFGLLAIIATILGLINAFVWKDETAESVLDTIIHLCAGITGGLALCIFLGQIHILSEYEYKEYKELKKQYVNLVNKNNQTCWNINGSKHCGDFTYEDNKTKIEVKNGSTNITVK